MQKLLSVFKADSVAQLIVIFAVFSVTGSTAVCVAGPVLDFFGINSESMPAWAFWSLRILVIFPIYQCLLIVVGTLAGQFKYFWEFERKFLRRLGIRLP
jgi:hypothetical protein